MSSQGIPTGYPVKPAPMPNTSPEKSGGSSGRILGCAAIGCGSIVLLLITLCGVGYWAIFYSSAPLRLVEQGLEQDGYVEIDGMKGNISTGVEVESFRFRNDKQSETWSELKDVTVRYKTTGSMLNRNGFVIEKVNIASARFYVDINKDVDFSGDLDLSGLIESISSNGGGQISGNLQAGKIEVKQVLLQDIVIIDKNDGNEIHVDEIRFEGLKVVDGELVHLGDITVRADMIEIQTLPSDYYADLKINRRYEIRLKESISPAIDADLPLSIDVGYTTSRTINLSIEAFKGQFHFDPGDKSTSARLEYKNFQPADFFSSENLGVMPSEVSARLERLPGKQSTWKQVDDAGSFRLGKTIFLLQPGDSTQEASPVFEATANVDGQTVTATAQFAEQLPLVNVRLTSDAGWSDQDLWAKTVFGKEFIDLQGAEKQPVAKVLEILARKAESNQKPDAIPAPANDDVADKTDETDESKPEKGIPTGSDETDAEPESETVPAKPPEKPKADNNSGGQ